MDCIKKKCNWCKKKRSAEELWKIDIWCKYYGMRICDDCYDKKMISSK